MKLQKRLTMICAIVMIILVICNVVMFTVPLRKTSAFWISDAFAVFSLLFLLYIYKIAFKNMEDTRSKAYGIPILRIGFIYVLVNIICVIVLIWLSVIFPMFQVWIAVFVYVILFGLAASAVIAAVHTKDYVEKYEVNAASSMEFMRQLRLDVLELREQTDDGILLHVLRDFADKINNSDSASSPATAEVEEKLAAEIVLLKASIKDSDTNGAMELCEKMTKDLNTRNELCKAGGNCKRQ